MPQDLATTVSRVKDLLNQGVNQDSIHKALTSKLGDQEASSVIQLALKPKLDKLRNSGVPEDKITKALIAHGISQPTPDNFTTNPVPQQQAPLTPQDLGPVNNTQVDPSQLSNTPPQSPSDIGASPQPDPLTPQDLGPSPSTPSPLTASQAVLDNQEQRQAESNATGPSYDLTKDSPQLENLLDSHKLPGFGTGTGLSAEKPDIILSDGRKLSEIKARVNNLTQLYSDMAPTFSKMGIPVSHELLAKAEQNKYDAEIVMAEELKKRLPEGQTLKGFNEYGDIIVTDAKTGKDVTYDENFLNTLDASAGEMAGAAMGFQTGVRLTAATENPVAIGVGAALGSTLGAMLGSVHDDLRNSYELKRSIDTVQLVKKMNDAGIADIALTSGGGLVIKGLGGIYRSTARIGAKGIYQVKRAWDFFKKGNPEGAAQVIKEVFNLNDEQAFAEIRKWEDVTGNRVLSSTARDTGTLTAEDSDAIMKVLSETRPGGQDVIAAAKNEAKVGGAKLSDQITKRANDLLRSADDIAGIRTGSTLRESLNSYHELVGTYFNDTKQSGLDLMEDSPYQFNFDVALIPAMEKKVKGISNSSIRGEFVHKLQQIRDLTNTPIVIPKTALEAKNAIPGARATVTATRAQTASIRAGIATRKTKLAALQKKLKTLRTAEARATAKKGIKNLKAQLARREKQLAKSTDSTEVAAQGVATATRQAANALQASGQGLASKPRSFADLIQLRQVLNELSNESQFKKFSQFSQLNAAKEGVDAEIKRAALEFMPSGKAWYSQWTKANIEYSKMKALENNALYKAINSEKASPDSIVKAIADSLAYIGPETFMQVMGKVKPALRTNVEGAVLRHFMEKNSVGFEGGSKALNLPKIAQELNKIAFTQPKARDLKRVINQFAEVFRNDVHLQAVTGNLPLPKFQSYLTDNPAVRLKYAFVSSVFHEMLSRIPLNNNAKRAALVKHLGRLLDNPLDNQSSQVLLKLLPDDPILKTKLNELAIQFVEFGQKENFGKVPLYRVYKPGKLNVSSNTMIGNGVLFYTDKKTAEHVAKQTESKVAQVQQLHSAIATPQDIARVLGRAPTKADLRNPEVVQKLKDKGLLGLAVNDKVILFK